MDRLPPRFRALAPTCTEPAAYAASNSDPFSGSEMDGWEIIGGVVGPMAADGSVVPSASAASAAMVAAHPEAIRIIMERIEALGGFRGAGDGGLEALDGSTLV